MEGQLGTLVLVVGLCAVLLAPLDVVWCRGSSGHDALEFALAGCCAPTDLGRNCATGVATVERATDPALPALGALRCADLWLGPTAMMSPPPPQHQQECHAIAAPGVVPPTLGCDPALSRARVMTPHARQVYDLIRTTVLTV
jgi:hypothetical protein